MKKTFLILALLLLSAALYCQVPQKMSYQAVIRNVDSTLVKNTKLGMRISILQGSANGTAVYMETQTPTTNINGLATLEIGAGVTTYQFSSIDWSSGPYYIKTETDITGGSNYTIVGTSQLLSVPYALYAGNVGGGGLGDGTAAGNTTYWNGSKWVLNSANIYNNGGNVGIGTTSPAATLDISSKTNGILIPRMTKAERDAIVSPASSMMIFNTTSNCFEFFMGNWQTIACASCSNPPSAPGQISGPTTVCGGTSGNIYSVSTVSGASFYTWTVPSGATIQAGQGTNLISVIFGNSSGDVTVTANNSCGASSAAILSVTINPAPATPAAITGSSTVCISSTGNVYSISPVSGATNYTWSVPTGANITAGQGTTSITVSFGINSGNVSVSSGNSCGTSAPAALTVTATGTAPGTPGTITGITGPCTNQAGVVYSIAAVTGANSYTWTVPPGASITAGQGTTSITVTFGTNSGNISVTASNGCGTSAAKTLAVNIINTGPGTPGAITGTAVVCGLQAGVVYSIAAVTGATSYTWSVPPGATITAGQGTTSITVTFGNTGGNISVTANNACGISAASNLAITISSSPPNTPGPISGNGTPCSTAGNIYTIDPVAGASSYTWSVPAGSTITAGQGTTSITVTFGTNSGNISVTANNGCGTSLASILAITISSPPAIPGAISGTTGPCAGQTGVVYTISPVTGAVGYTWTISTGVGTITSGQGTVSITVSFGSFTGAEQISVYAYNACGNSPVQTLSITVLNSAPSTPLPIVGFPVAATGQAGVVYSIAAVTGAVTYNWSVNGGTITAGQGTTSITVTWGNTEGSFSPGVSVSASNGCGTSGTQSLTITIYKTPTFNYQVISYTGTVQTFTVPTGVSSLLVIAHGAGAYLNAMGGTIVGTMNVTAGTTYNVIVGGAGGYGLLPTDAGSGSGFSGLLDGSNNHIISAGGAGGNCKNWGTNIDGGNGGGGNGSGTGGGAGGVNGGSPTPGAGGASCTGGNPGAPGTLLSGGNGGNATSCGGGGGGGSPGPAKGSGGTNNYSGFSGGFGGGGGSGSSGGGSVGPGGGGGGGGYAAGSGGAYAASGGGGSNYPTATNASVTVLQNTTGGANNPNLNGIVVIGW